jgi:hypothetical protein
MSPFAGRNKIKEKEISVSDLWWRNISDEET